MNPFTSSMWIIFAIISAISANPNDVAPPRLAPLLARQAASPAEVDCTSLMYDMAGCISFLTIGSKATNPDPECCSQFVTVLKTDSGCVCEALKITAKLGVDIDMKRVAALPPACNIKASPIDSCYMSDAPRTSPITAPAISPATSPEMAPTFSQIASPVSDAPQTSPVTAPAISPATSPEMAPIISQVAAPESDAPQTSPVTAPAISPTTSPEMAPTFSQVTAPANSPQTSPNYPSSPSPVPDVAPVSSNSAAPVPQASFVFANSPTPVPQVSPMSANPATPSITPAPAPTNRGLTHYTPAPAPKSGAYAIASSPGFLFSMLVASFLSALA